jgi:hypothetical protein
VRWRRQVVAAAWAAASCRRVVVEGPVPYRADGRLPCYICRVGLRNLSETKEGRLVIIAVVGGTLMIAASLGNLAMASAADGTAGEVRDLLRHELSTVSDATLATYPDSADAIEALATEAIAGESAQVLGSTRRGDQVLVAVQAGWGWQIRCVEAEMRGDATVLTYVRSRPCG